MSDKPLILIVDDDEAIRGSLHMLFESVMLESRTFDSAAALLADLPEDFAQLRPGALVLDVRMPGMSGLELLDVLTACGFALPILLISGHGDVEMAVEAMKPSAAAPPMHPKISVSEASRLRTAAISSASDSACSRAST